MAVGPTFRQILRLVYNSTLKVLKTQVVDGIALSSTTGVSSANAAQTLTVAASTGNKHCAKAIEVSIRAAAAGADVNVTLKDGSTVLWREVIGNAAPRGERVGIAFPDGGLAGSTNTAMTLEVEAGGASVVTVANLAYYTKTA